MEMLMFMVVISVPTGRGIDLSTTWLTMITAASLTEYDSPPQISG
jgi:hypothetical protein